MRKSKPTHLCAAAVMFLSPLFFFVPHPDPKTQLMHAMQTLQAQAQVQQQQLLAQQQVTSPWGCGRIKRDFGSAVLAVRGLLCCVVLLLLLLLLPARINATLDKSYGTSRCLPPFPLRQR